MAKVEGSVVIGRSIEEVFAFVTDLGNALKWQTGIVEARQTSDGPVQVGAAYKYVAEVLGRRMDTSGEVVAFDPPHRYAWKATSGPFPMSGETHCETVDGGTRVTDRIEAEPGGFFKLAEGLLARQMQGQVVGDLGKLKSVLEAGG